MNPSLTSQLAADRRASLLAEASDSTCRGRPVPPAGASSSRSIRLRAVRPLRLAAWRRGRVPA